MRNAALLLVLLLSLPSARAGSAFDGVEDAQQNIDLVKNTEWSWGRPQKGFLIYIPLIQETIGTKADYDTSEFATRLGAWKKAHDCKSGTGLLNLSAFWCLKEYWQGLRHTSLGKEEMVAIDRRHRYDPSRPDDESTIGREAYVAYQRMLTAAQSDGITNRELLIAASNVTPRRVAAIRAAEARGELGYAQAGWNSIHFTGRALDLHVGGVPVWSDDENRLIQVQSRGYRWLIQNASRFGFANYFYEPWHWDYIGLTAATKR